VLTALSPEPERFSGRFPDNSDSAVTAMHPISLDTPRSLYPNDHRLALHCPTCNVWREFSLADFEAIGVQDSRLLPMTFRCRQCGTRGLAQVRPPVPQVGGAIGYI
jgi:DNA-directed RNA polymerase subunit RPC12/RpoP